jgi:hypothetical protein
LRVGGIYTVEVSADLVAKVNLGSLELPADVECDHELPYQPNTSMYVYATELLLMLLL